MKRLSFDGLQGRMLLLSGSAVFLGLGLLTGVVSYQATRTVRDQALASARQQATILAGAL